LVLEDKDFPRGQQQCIQNLDCREIKGKAKAMYMHYNEYVEYVFNFIHHEGTCSKENTMVKEKIKDRHTNRQI